MVSSYDRILPPGLLDACPFVNVHYAPLPECRGRATVNWAIINRRPDTAITVHVLVAELDAGPILFQQPGARSATTTPWRMCTRGSTSCSAGISGRRPSAISTATRASRRTRRAATYMCTRVPADGEIDWDRPTADVHALVRALAEPFPGAFTYLDARRLVVWRAAPVESPRRWAGRVPGRVVGRSAAEGWVDVLTRDGVLRLHTVQQEGAPPTAACRGDHLGPRDARAAREATCWSACGRSSSLPTAADRPKAAR